MQSLVAIPFCVGNFPQLMRDFHQILTQPNATESLPTAGRPAVADELQPWVDAIARKKQFPQMLLALGAMRLANHFDSADAFYPAPTMRAVPAGMAARLRRE